MTIEKVLTVSQAQQTFVRKQDHESAIEWLRAEFEHQFGDRASELPLAIEALCAMTFDEIVDFAHFLEVRRVMVPAHGTVN